MIFRFICAIFRVFCLEVFRIFVYLHTVKGVATICLPEYINGHDRGRVRGIRFVGGGFNMVKKHKE